MEQNKHEIEMRRRAPFTTRLIALVFLTGVIVQVYLAGLAFFSTGTFEAHQAVGWVLILVAVALLVTTLISWRNRDTVVITVLLLLFTFLQPVLALGVRTAVPWLAATHTVNALAIFWLSIVLLKKANSYDVQR